MVIRGEPREDSPPTPQNHGGKVPLINFEDASRIWRANKIVASPLAFTYKREVGDQVFVRLQGVWRLCTVIKLQGIGSILVKAQEEDAPSIVQDHPLFVRSIWIVGRCTTSSPKEVDTYMGRRSGTAFMGSVSFGPPRIETCAGCLSSGGVRGDLIEIKCCKDKWHVSCMATCITTWNEDTNTEVEECCVRCKEKNAERNEEQIYAVKQRKIYRKRRRHFAELCVKRPRKNTNGQSLDLDESVDLHQSACYSCGYGGSLLCCDSCTLVWHLECLEGRVKTVPIDQWSCPICVLELQDEDAPESQVETTHRSTGKRRFDTMSESLKELSVNHRDDKTQPTIRNSRSELSVEHSYGRAVPKATHADAAANKAITKLMDTGKRPNEVKLDDKNMRTKPNAKTKLKTPESEKSRQKTKSVDAEPFSKSQRRSNVSASCGWDMVPSLSFDEQIALAIRMSTREDRSYRGISRRTQHRANAPSVLVWEEGKTIPNADEEFEFVILEGTRKDMVEEA